MTPSLSVVIPVYNESAWIGRVVADLVTAVERSPFSDVELIVVDDGSDDATREALAALETPFPHTVMRQSNAGRFAARRAGIDRSSGELVLLLDSRVSIAPDALAFVAAEMARTGPRPIWNGHAEHELAGNPYGRFWHVIESLAFREYSSEPRTTSYGLEEFDRFPKGTTCFLAPRDELQTAIARFRSYYEDERDANDDTPVIRTLAERSRINISPGFACLYRPRDSLRPFLRHAFHRGAVFVDGYGRPGSRFFSVIVMFYPLSALCLALGMRRPRLGVAALLTLPATAGAAGVGLGRSRADTLALAQVGPGWLLAFGAGMWRGLGLAVRARLRRLSRR